MTYIVINPKASSGAAKDKWVKIESILKEKAVEYRMIHSLPDHGTIKLVKSIVESSPDDLDIIACGGDGIMCEVVHGIMSASFRMKAVFGAIPLGTGNNLAKSLGIGPGDLEAAVTTALYGKEFQMDVGIINGKTYFTGSFSIGIDGNMIQDKEKHGTIHSLIGYTVAVMKNLPRYRRFGAAITIDGQPLHGSFKDVKGDRQHRWRKTYNLLVNSIPVYAGELRFNPDTDMSDGKMDLIDFSSRNVYIRDYFLGYLGKRVPLKRIKSFSELKVETDREVSAQIDGEYYGNGRSFAIGTVKKGLRIRKAF